MDKDCFYSIRMRAAVGDRQVSGAERIVTPGKIEAVVQSLVIRARQKKSMPDRIVITIERLGTIPLRMQTALNVVTVNAADVAAGRSAAVKILHSLEVSERATMSAMKRLSAGVGPSGQNLRGAMIIDALTGERLEPDQESGVRASRFDWTDEALNDITRKLETIELTHFRTREALALATKVAHAPCMVAELCWSDDPDYTAGYVASLRTGYVRFPMLKARGDPRGGRAFFVDRKKLDMQALVHYLQIEPMLINETGACGQAMDAEHYFK